MERRSLVRKFLSPGFLLLYLTAAMIIFSFVINGETAIDIHLHDTYFVIAYSSIFYYLAVFTGIQASIYLLTRHHRQQKLLQYVHVATFYILIIAFACLAAHENAPVSNGLPEDYYKPRSYHSYHDAASIQMRWQDQLAVGMVLLMLLGQFLFLVNIIIGFIRGNRQDAPPAKSYPWFLSPAAFLLLIGVADLVIAANSISYSVIDIHEETSPMDHPLAPLLYNSIICLLQVLIYYLLRRVPLIPRLRNLHVVLIYAGNAIIFFAFWTYLQYMENMPRMYFSDEEADHFSPANDISSVAVFLFIIGHLVFVINIILGLIRRNKSIPPHNNAA